MKLPLVSLVLALACPFVATGCNGGDAAGGADGGGSDASASADAAPMAATCTGKEALPQTNRFMLTVGGLPRTFDVHLPANYDPSKATPVVLNFHGLGSNAGQQQAYSKMIAKSDAEGFIAVHPEGTGARQSWNAGYCCEAAVQNNTDDVAFVRAMLDELESRLCVDKDRVFAAGMSNGGFMSHRLACDLSDRIAAVAPVAGYNVTQACAPGRAVPVLHFHGTSDQTVPYEAGANGFPGVRPSLEAWAQRNGCGATPSESFRMADAHCDSWPSCSGGSEVILCTIDGGGHTWPGAIAIPQLGFTSAAISATDTMWDFFERHPMPR